ncbi:MULTISPECIES: hypothetical protein [unclassified Erythrobacter]|uniref:hypothetical protein n=1 Tax=unclassified Erythrobacter TaxID=2633097 RepID=UPI0007B98281|nr:MULTISPECIES: hypothetical protein [unclassified Erythrobacter]KZY95082.1 hypothetical protein A3745_08140 [Erythrobacter sp. HI0074]KZZ09137.1 hypothetical protein A3748_09200 [Erythrobacter sp. HI0077]
MSRRYKSVQTAPAIPNDWIHHDGSPCPVDPASSPGVLFRAGTRFQAGKRRAEDWQQFSSGDLWAWAGRTPDGFDIIAYKPESEFVEIPRGGSVL